MASLSSEDLQEDTTGGVSRELEEEGRKREEMRRRRAQERRSSFLRCFQGESSELT